MNRKIVFGCLSLLLSGLGMGALSGCVAEDAELAEDIVEESEQDQDALIVSSISEGDYVIRSAMTNKCIDVSGSSTADGAKVQEWDCNGTNAQKFHISPTSDGYWKIINVNSGKGLDIKEVSTAQNALVHQWSYVGGNNQQFKFVGRGNSQFSVHARHTDMALDLYWGSADNGTTIVQYPYTGAGNQHWTFDKVDGTTPGNPGGVGLGAILSKSTFEAMFPSRSPFYTYEALLSAASTFPAFANEGDLTTRKREVAAFLANVSHETGGLVYVEEIAKAAYCDTSWGPPGCYCAAGKWYYGRGPIQLSWNGNYCAAGNALGLNLRDNPDLLAQDANAAWRTGFWFWTTQTGAGSMTPHNAMVTGAGFGQTIRTINGALECNGGNPGQVQSRIDKYNQFTSMLGVSPGSNLGC